MEIQVQIENNVITPDVESVVKIKKLSGRFSAVLCSEEQGNIRRQAHAICKYLRDNWRGNSGNSYDEFRQMLSLELGYTRIRLSRKEKEWIPIITAESWSYATPFLKFREKLHDPLLIFGAAYMRCTVQELIENSISHKINNA